MADPLPAVAAEVPLFFNIRAGASDKTGVDALLGAPQRQIKPDLYEYRAASGAGDIAFETVEYFPDTSQVARLEAYLKTPLPAAALRAQFGKPALLRERSDGKQEEMFFPRLNGLVYAHGNPDEVLAISYFSPRALADAFVDRANQHLRAKRYADMKEPSDNAVQADPDYARGYLSQGIYFYYQKDYDEALVRLVAATRARYSLQKQAQAHLWLGTVYWRYKNMPDKAREELQKALAMTPDADGAHLEYGRLLKAQKQFDQAAAEFTKAIVLNPAGPEARVELANQHFDRKDWKAALPLYKQLSDWADSAVATDYDAQRKSNIYSRYAYCLSATMGARNLLATSDPDAETILSSYGKALRLTPDNVWVLGMLGWEHAQSGNFKHAEDAYRKGLALDPKHLWINQNLANVLLEMRRYAEARRQAEYALSLKSDDATQMMNMARAYAALGNKEQALAWLRKAGAAGYKATMRGLYLEDGYFEAIVSDDELRRLLPGRR